MDAGDLAALAKAGQQLFTTKLLLTSVECLWIFDYLLTLGDEIMYAWSGRRSWVFALFITNRYTPLVHLTWVHVTMFHYSKPFCQSTKWVPIFHSTVTTPLAQTAIALRVYAITGKNKLIGWILGLSIAAGLCFDIFSIIWIALGPLQPIPDIDLDAFKICVFKLWNFGELFYYGLSMVFDVLAFSIILVTARRPRMGRHPGIPSILDTIIQDATQYFLLIFSAHLLSILFPFITSAEVQLFPAMINTTLVPVMASRLMLSLKKAGAEPKAMWTLDTMNNTNLRTFEEDGTVRFASQVPGGLPETSFAFTSLGEEALELDAIQ